MDHYDKCQHGAPRVFFFGVPLGGEESVHRRALALVLIDTRFFRVERGGSSKTE
jgi:hypothetical protein